MSCPSLTALAKSCGATGVMGGLLSKAYFLAYNDLDTSAGAGFTTSAGDVVNAVTLKATKKFVEVGLLKNTAGLTEKASIDSTKGLFWFSQDFTLVLSGMTSENRAFLKSVMNQGIVIMFQARSGNHYVVGLNGLLELSAAEGGTGTQESDLNGYTLTFSGIDTEPARLVDSTIVAGLIA